MTELHFQRGKLEISYDADNDVLWMANDKPAPRGFDIIKNQVIAFFDYDGTTPTAIMVFDAAELLSPFFDPSDGNVSESTLVLYGEQDGKEREAAIGQFLNPDTRKSDSLVVIHRNDDGDRGSSDIVASTPISCHIVKTACPMFLLPGGRSVTTISIENPSG